MQDFQFKVLIHVLLGVDKENVYLATHFFLIHGLEIVAYHLFTFSKCDSFFLVESKF